jgi:hypothetical protein
MKFMKCYGQMACTDSGINLGLLCFERAESRCSTGGQLQMSRGCASQGNQMSGHNHHDGTDDYEFYSLWGVRGDS